MKHSKTKTISSNDLIHSVTRGIDEYLLLENGFARPRGGGAWLFANPVEEITAWSPDDVGAAFARIEEAVGNGFHAAGFLSYELGYCFEDVFAPPAPSALPLLSFGIYRSPEVFDINSMSHGLPEHPVFSITELSLDHTMPEYEGKIRWIKELIEAGETYQIDFTLRLGFEFDGDPLALYLYLRQRQATRYSALWRKGRTSILSLSPELFFSTKGRDIETRPMKGTVRRGTNAREDVLNREFLKSDEKNCAENLMIVDLLRNDLGRVCESGTVTAPKLFHIETYETLFQMISTVRGRVARDTSLHKLFESIFPSGSVTGAPKIRSMQHIRELEISPRGIYTGAIGCIAPHRRSATFNVAIRTIALHDNRAEMGIGGGIVIDSDPTDEWREALLKAKFLTDSLPETLPHDFFLIETILWTPYGGFSLLDLHLDRLARSARRFNIPCNIRQAEKILSSAVKSVENKSIAQRVRLLLSPNGKFRVQRSGLPQRVVADLPRCTLSSKTVFSHDPFIRHKTSVRKLLDSERARAVEKGFIDVVFLNERGEITQGAITNVLLQIDGRMLTPPACAGLLEGVYRAKLLNERAVEERTIFPSDITRADAVFLCNSVRGMFPVKFVIV